MKIGIITHWDSLDNYGQQLQCWALQRYLKDLGHEPFLIKYLPTNKRTFWERVIGFFKYRLIVPTSQKEEDIKMAQMRKENRQLNKKREFEEFRKRFIVSTDVVYHSIDELRSNPPCADAYITGSDQVWNNPLSKPNTAGSFLDFGSLETKRVSYAASIGRQLHKNEMKRFGKYLSRFNSISVREQKAYDYCHSVGYTDAVVTIDPTLLLKSADYDSIKSLAKTEIDNEKPYVFFYLLNIRSGADVYWETFKKKLIEEGFSVRSVASSGYLPAQEFLSGVSNEQATIPDWLSLIHNSQYVVTTSFHGVVFCILYHKPFYAVLLKNEHSKANDRIFTLLKTVQLEKRIIAKEADIKDCSENIIDWDNVDSLLAEHKSKSINFLKHALMQ